MTGAGIALDAVTRGLKVGIVEAQDWSSGTSSRSSKLVHGGLRYLQMLDFHLVHEALTERDLLLKKIAPHLVRPVSFLYPLEHRVWERAYVGAGVALYDTLASIAPGKRAMPWHRHVTRTGLDKMFPDLRHDAAVGALRYFDASVDDARLVDHAHPHRRQLRRARREPHPGGRAHQARHRRGQRRRPGGPGDRHAVHRPRRPGDQRHRRVDRGDRGPRRTPTAACTCWRPRASTSSSRASGSAATSA